MTEIHLQSTITAAISILIFCLFILLGMAQLLWMALRVYEWNGLRAVGAILLSFMVAYVTLSHMVVVLRDFVGIPTLFWE